MAKRLSGLQKDVLSLYRKILRVALKKDRPKNPCTSFSSLLQQAPASSTHYAAQEFQRNAKSVKKSDFKRIEYMLRKGEKHVKLLSMPGVKVVGGVGNAATT